MTKRPFIQRADGAICMDGYPIRIEFVVVSDWPKGKRKLRCRTLDEAKENAYILASEIDAIDEIEVVIRPSEAEKEP